jgi:K+-transporting ATPase KdpF subunit
MAIKIFNFDEISTKIHSPNMETVNLKFFTKFFSRKLPIYLLSILLINIIISPLVYASTNQILSKGQSYALTLLGLVTISLFIYLFIVIFKPEKF